MNKKVHAFSELVQLDVRWAFIRLSWCGSQFTLLVELLSEWHLYLLPQDEKKDDKKESKENRTGEEKKVTIAEEKKSAKEKEPAFELLSNPSRVMKQQLKVCLIVFAVLTCDVIDFTFGDQLLKSFFPLPLDLLITSPVPAAVYEE